MTTYTTTNQKTVLVMRGGGMTRCDDSRMHGGDGFTLYGAANEATKIEKIKLIVALGDRWTTNSTQQPTKLTQVRQMVTHTGHAT